MYTNKCTDAHICISETMRRHVHDHPTLTGLQMCAVIVVDRGERCCRAFPRWTWDCTTGLFVTDCVQNLLLICFFSESQSLKEPYCLMGSIKSIHRNRKPAQREPDMDTEAHLVTRSPGYESHAMEESN